MIPADCAAKNLAHFFLIASECIDGLLVLLHPRLEVEVVVSHLVAVDSVEEDSEGVVPADAGGHEVEPSDLAAAGCCGAVGVVEVLVRGSLRDRFRYAEELRCGGLRSLLRGRLRLRGRRGGRLRCRHRGRAGRQAFHFLRVRQRRLRRHQIEFMAKSLFHFATVVRIERHFLAGREQALALRQDCGLPIPQVPLSDPAAMVRVAGDLPRTVSEEFVVRGFHITRVQRGEALRALDSAHAHVVRERDQRGLLVGVEGNVDHTVEEGVDLADTAGQVGVSLFLRPHRVGSDTFARGTVTDGPQTACVMVIVRVRL